MIKTTLALAFAASTVLAGPMAVSSKNTAPVEKDWCESLWDLPTLYKDKDASFFNEFRITGRFHGDYYNLDSGLGHDADFIVRRLRIGGKALFFHNKLTLHVEADLAPQDPNPLYSRLTDAYLGWEFSKAAVLKVGKHSTPFTLDGGTSSNSLITIDRNNLSNNLWFPLEYMPGVSLSGKMDNWVYFVGAFSGGSGSKEFGNFDAGNFGLASLGYDFGSRLGVKKALLRADYVYNQPNAENDFTRSFENIGSLNFQLDNGKWGFSTDLTAGSGYGKQADVWGFVVMPWYNITDKLQVVGRYTYMDGDGNDSIRFSRYESFVTSGRGDNYQEYYAGLNYFICGHKLKLQTGFTYASMDDAANNGGKYDGWTATTGLRVSW